MVQRLEPITYPKTDAARFTSQFRVEINILGSINYKKGKTPNENKNWIHFLAIYFSRLHADIMKRQLNEQCDNQFLK